MEIKPVQYDSELAGALAKGHNSSYARIPTFYRQSPVHPGTSCLLLGPSIQVTVLFCDIDGFEAGVLGSIQRARRHSSEGGVHRDQIPGIVGFKVWFRLCG